MSQESTEGRYSGERFQLSPLKASLLSHCNNDEWDTGFYQVSFKKRPLLGWQKISGPLQKSGFSGANNQSLSHLLHPPV